MKAQPERRDAAPGVRHPAKDLEAAFTEPVVELEANTERIGGLRVDNTREHGPVRAMLVDRPRQPSHETVDRVRPLRLVESRVADDRAHLVQAVLEPVRPRGEHLTAALRGDLSRANSQMTGTDRALNERSVAPTSVITASKSP